MNSGAYHIRTRGRTVSRRRMWVPVGKLSMKTDELRIPGVKKIAVLRALVLGDLIFALPALDALHATYPEAEIIYLGRPWLARFLSGRLPGMNRAIPFHDSGGQLDGELGYLIGSREQEAFFRAVQAEHVDLAVQMHGGGSASNTFIRRLGARVSIGSREPDAPELDRWIPYTFQQHEVFRCLEIAGLAGAVTRDLQPRLPVLASDRDAALPFLASIGGPFAIVHPGARDMRRCWPPEKFARAADACKRRYGLEIVLTGSGASDEERAAAVAAAMQETPVNLAGKLSLPALVGLCEQASLMLANDTGPLHLALAVGAKAVGLFWSEYAVKSIPISRNGFLPVIAWETLCPLCGLPAGQNVVEGTTSAGCAHETSFVEGIRVDEVLRAVDAVLREHPGPDDQKFTRAAWQATPAPDR